MLAGIQKNVQDFLILDLWMSGNNGIDLLRSIRDRGASIRAPGYLMKSDGLDELLNALRIISGGEAI